jgi:LPS-assembly lipoprotein
LSERISGPAPRRALLRGMAGLAALGATGCGFRPLYGDGGVSDSEIAAELAATRVALIPERFGQLLRRGLQQRLGRGGETAARWELRVGPSLNVESIGFLLDGTATRGRYIGTANWTLLRIAPQEAVASGFERAIEAYNIPPNQYFAADLSRDAAERRLAESLAEEVVTRLAVRLGDLRNGAASRLVPPVTQPAPARQGGVTPGGAMLPAPSGGIGGGLEGGIGSPDMTR